MKKAFMICGALAGLAAGALALWHYGVPAYRTFRENRALAQARQFLTDKRYTEASLSARQALQFNPRNLAASQIMADLAQLARAPQVLDWRRRVVELAPTAENKLVLASTALQFQEKPFPLASQMLAELSDSARELPAFHLVSAELAWRLNHTEEAIAQLDETCRLEPTNQVNRLYTAVLRLGSTNQAANAEARQMLEQFQQNPKLAPVALRWLVRDALSHKQTADAERFSHMLIALPQPATEDRLQYLSILKMSSSDEFAPFLAALQKEVASDPGAAALTASWMVREDLAQAAMVWLSNCPPQVQVQYPVPITFVECFMARKDWAGLERYLESRKWDDFEFLRLAFLSQAARAQNQSPAAESRWRSALREAGEDLGRLTTLLKLAEKWARTGARQELLWQIAQRCPREKWALTELERIYLGAGNTLGLYKVYTTRLNLEPSNSAMKNNVAATSLLLKLNLSRGHELAREAYSEHPDNRGVAATYAFSLHLQGKTPDALTVFQKLSQSDLESPQVAFYYGLVLAASGGTNNAAKYLAKAREAELLPEEKQLLASVSSQK